MRLKGKVSLVTGSASGIGEATAKTFAREGSSVVVVDVNEEGGNRVVEEIRRASGTAEFLRVDAAKPLEVERMVRFTTDRFGRLDVLHNNAISLVMGRVGEITLEQWQRAIDVGLTSYWYATKVALEPMLKQNKGAIVNTASISALAADFSLATYNVAKAGVLNLTRATAIEYARKGIRCNAVCPGPIATPPMRKLEKRIPEIMGRVHEAVPMGRMGEPDEIANVVLFLASDEASYVTGAFIVADGGMSAYTGMPSFTGLGPAW